MRSENYFVLFATLAVLIFLIAIHNIQYDKTLVIET